MTEQSKPKNNPHADKQGHRDRLRQRIIERGAASLHDYEILEALLFNINKRGDTKPVAKALLDKFGSFRGLINASQDELESIKGIGKHAAVFLILIYEMTLRLSRHDAFANPVLSSWNDVITYCRERIGFKKTESFMVLYLNSKNRVIHDEEPQKGTVDRVMVYPREIVKAATQHDAASVILVHNHPSDHTEPSKADIEMTKAIVQALQTVNISVHDHIIIGPSSHTSFKTLGLL